MKRGDMLFVGASGNNGTQPTMVDGKRNSSINYKSFPVKGAPLGMLKPKHSTVISRIAGSKALRAWPGNAVSFTPCTPSRP